MPQFAGQKAQPRDLDPKPIRNLSPFSNLQNPSAAGHISTQSSTTAVVLDEERPEKNIPDSLLPPFHPFSIFGFGFGFEIVKPKARFRAYTALATTPRGTDEAYRGFRRGLGLLAKRKISLHPYQFRLKTETQNKMRFGLAKPSISC